MREPPNSLSRSFSHIGEAAARQYGVDPRSIRGWKKQQECLIAMSGNRKRVNGGGKKAMHPQEELAVASWVRITCFNK